MSPDEPIHAFLIGAMKCGTNTLYHHLANHPQVVAPKSKELDYFVRDDGRRGYFGNFVIAPGTRATIDGTTQYSKHPAIPLMAAKIAKSVPEARIIYTMRDPLERLESQIAHHIARGEGVTLDDWRGHAVFDRAVQYGRYFQQISLFAAELPRECLFLGLFEELISDQKAFFAQICGFLGIDAVADGVKPVRRNPRRDGHGAEALTFSAEEDAEFAQFFADDVSCLQDIFGIDTAPWSRFNAALSR